MDLIAKDVKALDPYSPPKTTSSSPVRAKEPETVECVVSWVLPPDSVMVQLAEGVARIDVSAIAPGVEPERLFAPGQKLTGTIRDGLLTITSGIHTIADAVAHARAGIILPALVLNEKRVALFPGLVVRHASQMEPGSVIVIRIELSGRADGKAWKISAEEAPNPESITPALPFCVGAEPWIDWSPPTAKSPVETAEPIELADSQPLPGVEETAPTEEHALATTGESETPQEPVAHTAVHADVASALELIRTTLHTLDETNRRLEAESAEVRRAASNQKPAGPVPSPGAGGAALNQAQRQVALLTRERIELVGDLTRALRDADTLAVENTTLAHENDRLREIVRIEQARAAHARQLSREIAAGADAGPLFTEPAEQFRHEIYVEWVTRIPASSKADMPLAEYDLADGFLPSVEQIQGIDRSKIVAVAVEVLTGIADTSPGRDMHRLRSGPKGNNGFVEHAEHGTAWRVALQSGVAAARRMHFWRGTAGRVMFASVGIHDDMDI
ncbi:hypothetical protein [Arthrobacter bussei]|uniref:S1 motif domain-containing protein n=1 Tax=Arthrobacter bussei TaxID=2594179 RepID=A0A7X1NSI3_9MICC|nr:hypothetical protein [Arthrobacter bussei]MPY12107.1 hypothetical protein [Arthrobacter bussei]